MAFLLLPIVDPDDINTNFTAGTGNLLGHYDTDELHINAVDKTFYFKGGGNLALAGSGVTGQALYSFYKDRWQDTVAVTKFDFPMLSITNEQFEFIDAWIPDDGTEYVATSLTFATATPDTISQADGIDFTDYFKAGDSITITGNANDGNVFTIDSLTATVITLITGDTVSAEAAVTGTITSNVVAQSGGFTTTTSNVIRTAGWAQTDGALVSKRNSGVVTLGTLVDNTDQMYITQSSSFTALTFNSTYTGPLNEFVRIYSNVEGNVNLSFDGANAITSDPALDGQRLDVFEVDDVITVTGGANDAATFTVTDVVSPYELTVLETNTVEANGSAQLEIDLTSYFSLYVREVGKLYADSNLGDIGVTTMTYIVYRFPVSNATDLNWTVASDANIDAVTTSAIGTDLNFATTTTITSAGTELPVLADGDRIKIVGSSVNDGYYTVNGASSTALLTINETWTVVDDSGLSIDVTADGVADVDPYDLLEVQYLSNTFTIRGPWTDATVYNLNDVVYDTGNSLSEAIGARWYYITNAGTSNNTTMNTDTSGITWTVWDKASGYGERWISGVAYAFDVIIDANNTASAGDLPSNSPYIIGAGGTKEEVYNWSQWSMRQTDFIDVDATRNGNVAEVLVSFVGSTLETTYGVFVDDIASADANNINFYDWEGTKATYPLVVTVALNFNNNLTDDSAAVFYAYYKDPAFDFTDGATAGTAVITVASALTGGKTGYVINALAGLDITLSNTGAGTDDGTYGIVSNTASTITIDTALTNTDAGVIGDITGNGFGTVGALQVQKSPSGVVGDDVVPVANNVQDAGSTYEFGYAFDTDQTGGRIGKTDTIIVVVAIGLETGQYVQAEGTITSTGAQVSLVAPLERNYSNPV